jgi:RND superfamily putative drug exporter
LQSRIILFYASFSCVIKVKSGSGINLGFFRLGNWVATHPKRVLLIWICLIGAGAIGAHKFDQVTVGGAGGIENSPSFRVAETLRSDFSNPYIDPLVIAVHSSTLTVDADPYLSWVRRTAEMLGKLPEVRKVSSFADSPNARMRSPDSHSTMIVVGLIATENEAQQKAVVAIRAAMAAPKAEFAQLDPHSQVAVTGGPAADFDVNAYSATGGDHAEKRALPLTLLILVIAFGTLVASCLPFLMGLATTTVALGLAFLLARVFPVSNLLSNVVTMVGLAIGIDYSLLMVTHFREHPPGESVAATIAGTVAQAGQTITWSGFTVIVGFLGLLFSPILETRCAGIGGALVVLVSVLAALTLLPASLVLLSKHIDRWHLMPQRLRKFDTSRQWHRLGAFIVRHPLITLLLSSACVLALASPLLEANSGVTNERWFLPKVTEARAGSEILTAVRNENASIPINVIVKTSDGELLLAKPHLKPLYDYAEKLKADKRVAAVGSPLSLQKGLTMVQYNFLYGDPEAALTKYPQIAEAYISKDHKSGLFEITPANGLSVKSIEQLTRDIARIAPEGPFTLAIGGTPAEHNDFNDYMFRSLPRIFTFVVIATLILLFSAFRSYLLPLKAVITNLLAVAAGIGAVVAVFQLGWLNGLVGLEKPFTAIPLEVPMMVFCLSFGLSMDYELFLLFRIQREYDRDHDNSRATIDGLAAVAPVITGAGLIMAVVFGAFVGAELPVLKMMGVGLCVSVLVDATVIRAFVVPSVMALAGRWNWYPGRAVKAAPQNS